MIEIIEVEPIPFVAQETSAPYMIIQQIEDMLGEDGHWFWTSDGNLCVTFLEAQRPDIWTSFFQRLSKKLVGLEKMVFTGFLEKEDVLEIYTITIENSQTRILKQTVGVAGFSVRIYPKNTIDY